MVSLPTEKAYGFVVLSHTDDGFIVGLDYDYDKEMWRWAICEPWIGRHLFVFATQADAELCLESVDLSHVYDTSITEVK